MSARTSEVPDGVFRRALEIQKEASSKGLDWPNAYGVLTKIREELDEVEAAVRSGAKKSCSDEIGDLLFSVVNLARVLVIEPEDALKDAVSKFERRFRDVLASIKKSGQDVEGMSIEELDVMWEATKRTT